MTLRSIFPLSMLAISFVFLTSVFAGELPKTASEKSTSATTIKVGEKEIRQTVEKSLPFLEKAGLAWMKNSKCVACHHSAFMLWSHREARLHGFNVDEKKIEEWTAQSMELINARKPEWKTKKQGGVEAAHLLLGQAGSADDAKATERRKILTDTLIHAQKDDGMWTYEGQGLKRPAPENDQSTTLWAVMALTLVEKADPNYLKSRERAMDWLKKAKPGDSNEWLVVKILVENRFGDAAKAKELVQDLLKKQNPDGGWSWSKERPSEAFATGQTLYALGQMGTGGESDAVKKAWSFLAGSQKPDGSWASPTRKANTGGNPIATYWGTAWATIGLAKSLPERK